MNDETKDGGPAFPRTYNGDGHNGMTLRDYFAAKAMQGFLANPKVTKAHTHRSVMKRDECIAIRTEVAWAWADAMLAAREAKS